MWKFFNKIRTRWQCRKNHIASTYVELHSWFEYESEHLYAEKWDCKHCGKVWFKHISAIEASRRR